MRTKNYFLFILAISFLFSSNINAQVSHAITNNGLKFTPAELTIDTGDSVKFSVGSSHPVAEVSKETWDANGSTRLSGGFLAPKGTETIVFKEPGTYYYICENHIGAGMKGKIVVQGALSVDKIIDNHISVTLSLNPVNEFIDITLKTSLQEDFKVSVFSVTGQIISQSNYRAIAGTNNLSVPFSSYAADIYFLHLRSNNVSKTLKFSKQ